MEAQRTAQVSGNAFALITAIIFLGRVCAVRGELHQAAGMFQTAIQKGGRVPILAIAHLDLAALYYEWNALDVSDKHLQKAIVLCQRSHNDEFLAGCWLLGSRLRIAQGDIEGAQAALEHAKALVRGRKIPAPMDERVNVAQAYVTTKTSGQVGECGATMAFKSAKVAPETVCVVGFDASQGARRLIQSDSGLRASVAAQCDPIGRAVIGTAQKLIAKQPVAEWVEVPNAQYLVTVENVGQTVKP